MGSLGLPLAFYVFGFFSSPGALPEIRDGDTSMLLFDVSEKSGVAEILFTAGTTILSLGIFMFTFSFNVIEGIGNVLIVVGHFLKLCYTLYM